MIIASALRKLLLKARTLLHFRTRIIIWSILLSSFLCLTLNIQFSKMLEQNILKDQAEYEENTANSFNDYLYFLLKDLHSASTIAMQDTEVMSAISTECDNRDFYANFQATDNNFNKILLNKSYIEKAIVLGSKGFSLIHTQNFSGLYAGEDFDLFRFYNSFLQFASPENEGKLLYFENTLLGTSSSAETLVKQLLEHKLVYYRLLKDKNNQLIGMLLFTIDPSFIKEAYPSLNMKKLIILSDDKNHLIWSNGSMENNLNDIVIRSDAFSSSTKKEQVTPILCGEKKYQKIRVFLPSIDLFLTTWTSLDDFSSKKTSGTPFNTAIILLISFTLLLSLILSYILTRPLIMLVEKINASNTLMPEKLPISLFPFLPKSSLRRQLFLYFLVVVIIPCFLFAALLFYQSLTSSRENDIRLAMDNMRQNKENIDYRLRLFNDFSMDISYSNSVRNFLIHTMYQSDTSNDKSELDKLIFAAHQSLSDFMFFKLYDNAGKIVYSNFFFDNVPSENFSSDILNMLESSSGNLIYLGSQKSTSSDDLLVFARKLKTLDLGSALNDIGYMQIYLNQNLFLRLVQNNSIVEAVDFVLADRYNNLISYRKTKIPSSLLTDFSSSSNENIRQVTTENKKYVLLSLPSSYYEFKLLCSISDENIKSRLLPIFIYSSLIILLWGIIGIISSTFLSAVITRPLSELRKLMLKLPEHATDIRFDYTGSDEVGILAMQFNMMVERLEKLIEENYEAKIREGKLLLLEKEAQFQALQQQINPHFLYNTLDSIQWMAFRQGAADVSEMTSALGNFLRGTIANSKDTVFLSEELEHLQNYIYIQEIRYRERLKICYQVPEQLGNYRVLRFILQPLVENAILHGIDSLETGGEIKITAYSTKSELFLEVTDDGIGMSENTLNSLKARIYASDNTNGSIGLLNVYHRLKLYFKENGALEIISNEGQGTKVRIKLPLIE